MSNRTFCPCGRYDDIEHACPVTYNAIKAKLAAAEAQVAELERLRTLLAGALKVPAGTSFAECINCVDGLMDDRANLAAAEADAARIPEFLGFLCAAIPELAHFECPKMLILWDQWTAMRSGNGGSGEQ